MSKTITLLGSTGSIGTQSLDVCRMHGYSVFGLAAHSSVEKILDQIREFHPRYVVMVDPEACRKLEAELAGQADAPRLMAGPEGLRELAAMEGPDVVLNAVVGIAGLDASLAAIESGHDLALANKESLVTGGHLVTDAVKQHGVHLLPVDSEHSAIFQCLQGAQGNRPERLILTASGGPFRTLDEFCRRMVPRDLNRRAVESLIKAGAFDSLGFKRRALLTASGPIIDSVTADSRKNIAGQLDLFGMGGESESESVRTVPLPDVPEFTRQELMTMERETTGLYLTGHPMDDYRDRARDVGAVAIGAILNDFAEETPRRFRDGQEVLIAGVVASYKTRTTRNNTLMSYIQLEDDTGSMELLAFQRALDSGGSYVQDAAPLLVRGKISLRDEKEPQLMVDSIRPLSDLDVPGRTAVSSPPAATPDGKPRTLYVRIPGADHPLCRRVKLLLTMFPGNERIVLYMEDTKKRLGAPCLIHPAFVAELEEQCGKENVVVK